MTGSTDMNGDRAWALFQLHDDYVALGHAALAQEADECRFRLSIMAGRARTHELDRVVAGCQAVTAILDRPAGTPMDGIGLAYAALGDAIASFTTGRS